MWDWENLYKIIANNIRNKRKQLHMSQSRLAEKAGLSVDTIKSVEQGRRSMSLDTFLKIVDALQVAPQELINGAAFDVYVDRFTFMIDGRNEIEIEFALYVLEQILKGQDYYTK
jgi:transcriptional regulator with XRE-family HTH domain